MMNPTDTIWFLGPKFTRGKDFQFLFKGKQLEDEKTLCDYGFEEKDSIVMEVRLIS